MTTRLACGCGQVQLEVDKAPIVSSECYCNSCREAGARLEALPGAPKILLDQGGTRFVLYRKDRVRFVSGFDRLKEFRLKKDSPTRRVVASCCGTPVFLEFKGGHWLSLYAGVWPKGSLPQLELRTMTSDLPAGTLLDNAVPNGKRQSISFFAKLLGAWIAMGFRSPKIPVTGTLDA